MKEEKMNKIFSFILGVLFTFGIISPVYADSINIDAINAGWYSDKIAHNNVNTNYFVGVSDSNTFHNFFSFDLTGLHKTVVSAELELTAFAVRNDLGIPFDYQLFDVQTNINDLKNDVFAINKTIYDDLNSGKNYGEKFVDLTNGFYDFTTIRILLNKNALNDINSNLGGYFSVGGSIENAPKVNDFDFTKYYLFGASAAAGDPFSRIARLNLEAITPPVVTPEPVSSVLFLIGGGVIGLTRLRRRV